MTPLRTIGAVVLASGEEMVPGTMYAVQLYDPRVLVQSEPDPQPPLFVRHSLTSTEHVVPVVWMVHVQLKPLIKSVHVPPKRHGLEAHSLMSV